MGRVLKVWTDKGIGQCAVCSDDLEPEDRPGLNLAEDGKLYCRDCLEPILETKVVHAAVQLMADTRGLQLPANLDLMRRYLNLSDAVAALNKL